MDYKVFYNKFMDKEFIFREEFLFDLVNEVKFSEEEASTIIKCLKYRDSLNKEDVKEIVYRRLGDEASNFRLFLDLICNKLIVSKTVTSIVENTFIKLIEDLTSLTGGLLIYKSQMKVIYDVIGAAFMWEELDLKKTSPEEVKEYFLINMVEYSSQYPNLTLKLMKIIDTIPLEESEDFFEDCSLRNNLLTNLKRETIKTKEKPA